MSSSPQVTPTAIEVRILRFLYEHGPSSIDDFYERSGYSEEGHSHYSALESFRVAAQRGLVGAVETTPGSAIYYHALIEPRVLRALLVRNAVNVSFGAQTEDFRELMAEFAKLPRE